MKEQIKKFDGKLETLLWVTWIILVGLSYLLAVKISAPKYEVVDTVSPISYTIETEDGDRVDSKLYYCWMHEFFKSPKAVFYDPKYDEMKRIKDKFYHESVMKMGESEYSGIIYHAKWMWFVIFVIIASILVAVYGDRLRDRLVCNRIKKLPDFLSCTYFLFSDRSKSTKKEIMSLIPLVADSYIESRKYELERKFSPALYNLVMFWLSLIKLSGSTTIAYQHVFKDELIEPKKYFNNLLDFYNSKRGIIPEAESYINSLREYLTNDYVSYPKLTNNVSYTSSITTQLNKLFTEIMGSEIFRFQESQFFSTMRVTTVLRNSTKYYTWSGSSWSGKRLPGICINVYIERNMGSNKDGKNTMWYDVLLPVSTYKSTDEEFKLEDFYTNMVVQTLDTLNNTLTKEDK